MAQVVIIGAGLTGLSVAYHLEQHGFFDYTIYEKESEVGGLCRSVQHEGYTFDYTGHLIHISNDHFKQLLTDIGFLNECAYIPRNAQVYSHNTYTSYPFQSNLYGLPSSVVAECIEGFITRKKNFRKPTNLHQWILKYFGKGIGKHFLFPYNEKILSYNIKAVDPAWTGRFVPSTSLHSIIEGALYKRDRDGAGYNSYFYYPKQGGISRFPQLLGQCLKKPIVKNHEVTSVDLKRKKIQFLNGTSTQYDYLITSMPLAHFLTTMRESTSTTFSSAASYLHCNSVLNINIGIKKPQVSDFHWLYFPEKKFPFYRVGCWTNFTKSAAPHNHSSLYCELSYMPGTLSSSTLTKRVNRSIDLLSKLFSFSHHDIDTIKNLTLEHAYVIYTQGRKKKLSKLLEELKTHSIVSAGRFGEWKYSSMQEAILDGKKVAGEYMTLRERKVDVALL